jgi:methylthioribose-1-phosphate isomerase
MYRQAMRTIDWVDGAVEIIDQTALPASLRILRLSTVEELTGAVRRLAVRGAPALGVAGALGVALAARQYPADPARRDAAIEAVRTARPTAVNLAVGVRRAAARLPGGAAAVLAEAVRIRDEEIHSSAAQARLGADLIGEVCPPRCTLLTHCNSGALAAVVGGTALGAVAEAYRRGLVAGVVASETRPLLQGARLTTWELSRLGIACRVAVDGAGPFLMARGQVHGVVVGADRICANGDVVNKIGTYPHALGAWRAGIPFIVVAPESTVDVEMPGGDGVEIEDRGAEEILSLGGVRTAADGVAAVNPAFDVTPADLVTAIVTDRRVLRPSRGERP